MSRPNRFLRRPQVEERTGLSRATIYRLQAKGEFPKNHRLSDNIVGWIESDIENWITDRITTA